MHLAPQTLPVRKYKVMLCPDALTCKTDKHYHESSLALAWTHFPSSFHWDPVLFVHSVPLVLSASHFFFAIIRHRASVYADLVVVLCVCTLMSCMIAQESNKNCGAGWLSSQKSIFQMWECYYDGDILLHFKISYFNLESDFWCLNLICPITAVAHQSNIHLKEPSYS